LEGGEGCPAVFQKLQRLSAPHHPQKPNILGPFLNCYTTWFPTQRLKSISKNQFIFKMFAQVVTSILFLATFARAHFSIDYPEWRGDSFATGASQYIYPCKYYIPALIYH
jgi:hypothetical protein